MSRVLGADRASLADPELLVKYDELDLNKKGKDLGDSMES
jgi:hypothetical protein